MLINVKMPTIVGILTLISIINTTSESLKAKKSLFGALALLHSECLKLWSFGPGVLVLLHSKWPKLEF